MTRDLDPHRSGSDGRLERMDEALDLAKNPSTARRDLAICTVIVLGLFVLSGVLDVNERWHAWTDEHEDWELDEIITALALSTVGFAWFAFRRWRESTRELDRRREIARELRAEIATRRETESSLRESEERLRLASRLAKIRAWWWSAETKLTDYLSWHGDLLDSRGRPASGVSNSDEGLLQAIHPDDRQRVSELWDRAYAEHIPYEIEYRLVFPNGEVRHNHEIGAPEFDESGRYLGHFGTTQNVTDRKRAEEARMESEEMFSRAFHASPALLAISRIEDGTHYDVNETWMSTLGYSHAEAMAGSALKLGIWADTNQRAEFIERLKKERSVRAFEATFRTKGGELHDFLVAGEYVEVGGETRLLVASQDITERVAAERALRESEERLRQASQLAKIGYYVWDAVEDRCLFCSERHARIHGLSPEEYIAQASALDGSFSLTHPDDREPVRAACKRVRAGERIEMEYRVVTPDGKPRYVHEIAEPVFDDKGRVVREIGTTQDITARKQIEDQLRQAQKMEALGQLTGGVAHDFNNMLAAIIGNLEILGDHLDGNDDAMRSLDIAFKASLSAAALTDRLLSFSRPRQVEHAALDLRETILEMRALLRTTLGGSIEFKTQLPEATRTVWADPVQLQNVIINLAANARDAMPNGGRFTIEAVNADFDGRDAARHPDIAPGPYVVLSLGDNGSGISPEVKARVFDPFFTTKEVGKGTGLGLSTVFGFMKQLGGHIELDSEEGRGTCVKLYLPAADGPAAESPPRPAPGKAAPRGSETILIVEDSPDVGETASALLENLGYRVVLAENGPSALALIEGGRDVDLIFTDTVMPGGMNGFDLAREAQNRFPGIKVLRTSGDVEINQDGNGQSGQDIEWIAKPYFQKALAEKIRQVLDGPRAERPAASRSPGAN